MVKLPPPLRDLYPHITSFPTLLAAFRKASRGKRYRPDVLAFAANLEAELFLLQHELRSFLYVPGAYRQFLVHEPKKRLVSAAPFRDRVVHHALIAVIAPPLERRISCPGTLWLLSVILANGPSAGPAIDGFPGDTLLTPLERPRGLPIGNLTSQFLANLHLDALDHHLRELPGVRAHLRCVDDLALFADEPEPLRQALVVLWQELANLRLRLHPSKTHLHRTAMGASFVGFHLIGGRIRLRNHSLLRIRRGLRRCAQGLEHGRLRPARVRASALSWNAHLVQGHTVRLRRRLFAPYSFCAGLVPAPP